MKSLLFTPGPLTTSDAVKEHMLSDLGSRDYEFIKTVREIRAGLLHLAGLADHPDYDSVIVQGSGTFGIESVISSAIPDQGELLVIINGAYGERMAAMAAVHGIRSVELRYAENQIPDPGDISNLLSLNKDISHVALVHCETTTGIINPVEEIGQVVRSFGCRFIVDAMSSFGGVPMDFLTAGIDYLISSSNKCIEGVPGFSFVIARKDALEACAGQARTLSLDLHAQWAGLEATGQFRFTPPVQVLLAFNQAIRELLHEGGVAQRARRYQENNRLLVQGMRDMGFQTFLSDTHRGYIITTFLNPLDPAWAFDRFYNELNVRGFVIYPGKLTQADTFRIGNIGHVFPEDIRNLVTAIRELIGEMGVLSCSGY